MTNNTVLHVVGSLNFGGVESHIRIIALNAKMTGFKHIFCVISEGGAIADELIAAKCPVIVLKKRSKIPSIGGILTLIKEIRSRRPSILHCHGAEANFHGLIAGYICGVPVRVAEEIGIPQHSRNAQIVFRYVYRLAHAVVAISEGVKKRLIDLQEVHPERVFVLLNPTQMQSERDQPELSDSFRLGFVGRLEKVKNPLALIQAAALLRNCGLTVQVTIVGDGSQRDLLEKAVKQLRLESVVDLVGFDPKPFDRLRDIDLYIQPSLSEGFGLALVEAMSVGIPVLATSVGGVPEIISDGENGWLLTDTNPEAIASGIKRCSEMDAAELRNTGRLGRKSVFKRFSPATYFKACDAFYTGLIQEHDK